MKKDREKKLVLNRETLTALTPRQLTRVEGAVGEVYTAPDNPFPSMCSCCITECCC